MIEDKLEYEFNDIFKKCVNLNSKELSVLFSLIDGNTGENKIVLNELARKIKISKHEVRSIIHELEQQKLLKS